MFQDGPTAQFSACIIPIGRAGTIASLYLVAGKEEIDRRRRLLGPSVFIEVWQDLYTPDIVWLGDAAERRMTYAHKTTPPASGLFWMGETTKVALESAGGPLGYLLSIEESAVSIYYGPHMVDIESLPTEESLKARVLSGHGIAVAWRTYDRFGQRREYAPADPTDATFVLRRPRGRAAHLWHLFRTRSDAVEYMTEHHGTDLEAVAWAERLVIDDFPALLERFGHQAPRRPGEPC